MLCLFLLVFMYLAYTTLHHFAPFSLKVGARNPDAAFLIPRLNEEQEKALQEKLLKELEQQTPQKQ